jgi:hypothetical protein
LLQPFAALYVLILATFAPILAKESEKVYALFERAVGSRRLKQPEHEPDPAG